MSFGEQPLALPGLPRPTMAPRIDLARLFRDGPAAAVDTIEPPLRAVRHVGDKPRGVRRAFADDARGFAVLVPDDEATRRRPQPPTTAGSLFAYAASAPFQAQRIAQADDAVRLSLEPRREIAAYRDAQARYDRGDGAARDGVDLEV